MRHLLVRVAIALVLGGLLGAAPALATDYTVVIAKMKFGPVPAELHVGDNIIWQNDDVLRHTATARDKSFDVELPPGTSVKTALSKSGTIAFYCRFHPGMTGTLVVAP